MRFPHCQLNPGIRSAWLSLISFFCLSQTCLSDDPSRGHHHPTSAEDLISPTRYPVRILPSTFPFPSSSAGNTSRSEIPSLSLSVDSNYTILSIRGYQNYDVIFESNKRKTFNLAMESSTYSFEKTNKFQQLLPMAKKYKRFSCPNTVTDTCEYSFNNDLTMSFIDYGSSGGLFPLLASFQHGFGASYGVDHDAEYVELSNKVYNTIYSKMNGWQVMPGGRPFTFASSTSSAKLRADVVNAMGMVHWMFSATENYRSIRKVVKQLADSARFVLIIEWIDPEDGEAISANVVGNSSPDDAYTFVNFINALKESCAIISDGGAFESTATRHLYYCSKYAHPDEAHVESQYMYYNASNSMTSELDCFGHSAVGKSADDLSVIKRVNLKDLNRGMLHRDFYWLEMLRAKGHKFVPRALSFNPAERILTMSYEGEAVTQENLPNDWEAQLSYIEESLYNADCHHNDELTRNFVVNGEGKLRILDFGWARHRESQDMTCKDFCNPFPYHLRLSEATSCSISADKCLKEYVFERPFYAGVGFEDLRAEFRRMADGLTLRY